MDSNRHKCVSNLGRSLTCSLFAIFSLEIQRSTICNHRFLTKIVILGIWRAWRWLFVCVHLRFGSMTLTIPLWGTIQFSLTSSSGGTDLQRKWVWVGSTFSLKSLWFLHKLTKVGWSSQFCEKFVDMSCYCWHSWGLIFPSAFVKNISH